MPSSTSPDRPGCGPARVEAWHRRQGVCQDIAHLSAGLLRRFGIPARYVSGYLHPKRDAAVGRTVNGQSHAWVEWWDGDWVGHDVDQRPARSASSTWSLLGAVTTATSRRSRACTRVGRPVGSASPSKSPG